MQQLAERGDEGRHVGERRRVQGFVDAFHLVTIDDAVRPLTDPEQIIATSARLLGEHLEVDRCAYAEIEPDQDTMNLTGNWCRHPGIRSIVGRMTFTSFGSQVLQLMRDDEAYVVNDIDTHRPPVHDRTAYRATQIQAVICVPLHKAGRFVAAMAVHTQTPRVWRSDEVELVLQTMQDSGSHLARVVGGDGEVVGIVFLEDVIEELVGEVSDASQR